MLREVMPTLSVVLRMHEAEDRRPEKSATRRLLRRAHQEYSPAEPLHAA
jgi:hypothetical protein